jgi:hypothetical protein
MRGRRNCLALWGTPAIARSFGILVKACACSKNQNAYLEILI